MNQLLNKLERRFGRYAIPDLIKYIMVLYCGGAALGIVNPDIYNNWLALDFDKIAQGQVWRFFTYLVEPYGLGSGMSIMISLIFLVFQVNIFFLFGRSLEQAWGTFRFNMYFLFGYLLNILAGLILYLSPIHASVYQSGFQYIYWSMFFAFAILNPDIEFLLFLVLPVKVKWLAILDALYLAYLIIQNLSSGFKYLFSTTYINHMEAAGYYFSAALAIVVGLANFLIFFFASQNYRRISPSDIKRRRQYRKQTQQTAGGTRHRCAVCGRTELDNPSLEFRYCSKCDGNFEYCGDHLFTHQHVKR